MNSTAQTGSPTGCATTMPVVNAPTLMEGMAELLHIATAMLIGESTGMGVTIWRDDAGNLVDAEADPEVAPGVLVTEAWSFVDPWADDGSQTAALLRSDEVRTLLEAMHVMTLGDIVATPGGVIWL